jgi:hypothetical protein
LTGPNSVECSPIRNTQPSSTGALAVTKPQAAISMIAISRFFTKRIIRVLSNLSVSWPAVAENSRNGRMNSAPIARPAMAGGIQLQLQLVGDHDGEGELEEVVVRGAERTASRRKARSAAA